MDATRAASILVEGGAASVTVIADREGDIYEEFARRPKGVDLVIRAAQNRVLSDGMHLHSCTDRLPELGRETVVLPAAPGRPARDPELALRARRVTIKRPRRDARGEATKLPPEITLTLVEPARSIRRPVPRRRTGGC